jgi:hypothetical protein
MLRLVKYYHIYNFLIKRIEALVEKVQSIANRSILGTEDYPASWYVPYDISKSKVTNITLDNNRTRSLMYNLDSLIELCIADNGQKHRWKECLEHYKSLFVMLRKQEDFSKQEIVDFQKQADLFYKIWIDIHGAKGVTNYIHMIGSGHVADFLEYYKNLYRHSQQGWENF